jgi:phosphonate dehydrogenase
LGVVWKYKAENMTAPVRKSHERLEKDRPSVLLTNRVFPEVIAYLERLAHVVANPNCEPFSREEFLVKAAKADALMVFMNDAIDAETLDRCPNLRVVAAALKGCDNFDVAACTSRGIWFSIVPDLLTTPTVELAIALSLGLARKILEGDRIVRSGRFSGWRPTLYGTGLSGRSAGIVGMGKLGGALAKRLAAFDMTIFYADPVALSKEHERKWFARRLDLGKLVAQSDFVFVLLPLAPQTTHLFDASMLARMKPESFLVNVGRGSVVDEEAVARALDSGRLAGYAADVFEMEDWARADAPNSIHPALIAQTEKTLFTPHLGSAVREVRYEIEMRAAQNIARALAGRRPPDAINEPRRIP